MDEAAFWSIIEGARGQAEEVTAELARLSVDEIAKWHRLYYDHHNALHRWELWAALDIVFENVLDGPASDDSFHYFKAWIIGKGREAYRVALGDPDGLDRFITAADARACCDNEALNYAAEEAWEVKGRDPDELDRRSNEFEEPSGQRCDRKDRASRYPRLTKRFGA
jgi:hypothetical protein